jgi:hypothetical protein
MTPIVASAAALLLIAVGALAYRRGRESARVRWPASLVRELREHKVRCLGEPDERVALEIRLLCETDLSPGP